MVSRGTVIKIAAWGIKMMLTLAGLIFLFSPGYALYLRVIGLVVLAIAVLTYNTTQQRLLSERGIRIPTSVTVVLLVGALFVFGLTVPAAEDLDVSDMRTTTDDETLTFTMTVTNTADGPVTSTDVHVRLNMSDETVTETVLEDQEFDRGRSRTLSVDIVALSELSSTERSRVESGDYQIDVVFDDDTVGARHRPG